MIIELTVMTMTKTVMVTMTMKSVLRSLRTGAAMCAHGKGRDEGPWRWRWRCCEDDDDDFLRIDDEIVNFMLFGWWWLAMCWNSPGSPAVMKTVTIQGSGERRFEQSIFLFLGIKSIFLFLGIKHNFLINCFQQTLDPGPRPWRHIPFWPLLVLPIHTLPD